MGVFKSVPGKASFFSLLLSGTIAAIMLIILVGGHLTIVLLLWFHFQDENGMQILTEFTYIPENAFIASIVLALLSDIWIALIDNTKKRVH
ncbi:MAG: hypothetical protein CO186_10175 [Zetaproteobacteria bacterium CG_4_9_14_3_um_filter_49_83]|nr:MAG: hypothetical protein AUJ56_02905 [Zetaproteobacteria bacterium CG1_02_49_23]PIQ34496.1 MAG: hypothetical protein COW62_01450 [Zetaproteobacteria bacterium CG17_big_fil_post_rev_8_21_14_2_50_50_13]PIV29784.1 MAG: hypothetical protein COS35_10175 [Zetaproteobacteria bacterium CG02_land_8_20_14_3_00_50_9]PIY56077.1 MAG: hypothetical protein COZ00_05935 [Zetaproteobacteria bacterium CG_4_10_14_0_8_um_filter_49_80]PJA34517.1 MAG: hypothetical protein CO186_10175 [Zetaproteobacteria bacterium